MNHQLSSHSSAKRMSTSSSTRHSSSYAYPGDLNPFGGDEDGEIMCENSESDQSVQLKPENGSVFNIKSNGKTSVNSLKPVEFELSMQGTASEGVSCGQTAKNDGINIKQDETVTGQDMIGPTYIPDGKLIESSDTSTTPKMSTPTPKPRSLRGTGPVSITIHTPDLDTSLTSIPDEHHPRTSSHSSIGAGSSVKNDRSIISEYPDDLDPFADDEEPQSSLTDRQKKSNDSALYNPFDDEEDEYNESLNPFSDIHEEKSEKLPPIETTKVCKSTPYEMRGKVFTQRKKPSPFQESPSTNPVPKPRTSLFTAASSNRQSSPGALRRETQSTGHLTPVQRSSRPHLTPTDLVKCINDVHISPDSPLTGRRKKAPAPKPPSPSNVPSLSSLSSSLANSSANLDTTSVHSVGSGSPISTPRRFSSANISVNNESDSTTASAIPTKVPRKKRRAPEPPKAVRRTVIDTIESIQANLNEIGDDLAKISGDLKPLEEFFTNNPACESSDVELKIYKYLELARETCILARRQEELMYARREHILEQEHADLEYEIREIDILPPFKRTADQESKSQELLSRLIEVIDQRNEVVEGMTKINKRPDFDKFTEKLKKNQKASIVDQILNKFLIEKDMSSIETRIYNPAHGTTDASVSSIDDKKEQKKKDKKAKKEQKELEKQQKKAKKERKYLSVRKSSIDQSSEANNDEVLSQTSSNSKLSSSLSKATSKSPLKVIKKFGTLRSGKSLLKDTSHSSKEKSRLNSPDPGNLSDGKLHVSSSADDETKTISNTNSLENHLTEPIPVRESHLI